MKKFILLPILVLAACGESPQDIAVKMGTEVASDAIQSTKEETEAVHKQAVESMAKIPGLGEQANAILADGRVSQEEYDELVAASKKKASDSILNLVL